MRGVVWGIVLALAAGFGVVPASGQDAASATVVFLVRHGETTPDGTRDPALSAEGRERADRLAAMLADVGLGAVYTTDYARTRGTADAVADRLGITTRLYDPGRLETFAAALRRDGGRALVVGHSNTTAELATALGGVPGPAIREDEHDRLYVLVLDGAGVETVLLRY
jgi:broad specificity phosphatase PhoE